MVSSIGKIRKIRRVVNGIKRGCIPLKRKHDLTEEGKGLLFLALAIEKVLDE